MGSFNKIRYGHPLFPVGTKRDSKRRADDRLGNLSHKKNDAMFPSRRFRLILLSIVSTDVARVLSATAA